MGSDGVMVKWGKMESDGVNVMPGMMSRAPLDFLDASGTGGRNGHLRSDRDRGGARDRDREALGRMIWEIAEEFPFYGHRRVAMELRRRGARAGDKTVRRIMREEGLRSIPRRPGRTGAGGGAQEPVPDHTDMDMSAGPDSPNLVAGLEIRRPDQVWAVDVTCIRLDREFVFLAAVMDLFSRRCIGWSLGIIFHHGHILRALRKAFRTRAGNDLSGLIVHSDRGLAGASAEYGNLLASRGIRMSVSRKGRPGDNARIERFFETLKYENICLGGYRAFEDALDNIRDFIEDVYDKKRLHSALGYMTPAEFEMVHANELVVQE
jgi:putative transposase